MTEIHGFADDEFGPVADAFAANFADGTEVGAACAIFRDGRLVLDLHAGLADRTAGRPWTAEALTAVFSISKGLLTLYAYLANQQGLFDFDASSCRCGQNSAHTARRGSASETCSPIAPGCLLFAGASPNDFTSRAMHAIEVPAANGILSAPALAKIYAAVVSEIDGPRLLTDESIADALTLQSSGDPGSGSLTPPTMRFSTGFMLNGIDHRPPLSDASFGHDGASGSLGYADADVHLGFAYVHNQMGGVVDDRANRLTHALRSCLGL